MSYKRDEVLDVLFSTGGSGSARIRDTLNENIVPREIY